MTTQRGTLFHTPTPEQEIFQKGKLRGQQEKQIEESLESGIIPMNLEQQQNQQAASTFRRVIMGEADVISVYAQKIGESFSGKPSAGPSFLMSNAQ